MTDAAPDVRARIAPSIAPSIAPWIGLAVTTVVIALAFTLPHVLDWAVAARAPRNESPHEIPPLHGLWEPKLFGPGTLPAVLLAFLGWRYAADLAARLPWRRLLLASYVVSLAWLLSLALVDGTDGLSRVLGNPYEYLETAREVHSVPVLLDTYIDRIPYSSGENWPTHVAGHPPATLLFFVALVRIGLGGDLALGRRDAARRDDRGGRARDPSRPRRRAAGPSGRRRSSCSRRPRSSWRSRRRRHHSGHRLGHGRPGTGRDPPPAVVPSRSPRRPDCSSARAC